MLRVFNTNDVYYFATMRGNEKEHDDDSHS